MRPDPVVGAAGPRLVRRPGRGIAVGLAVALLGLAVLGGGRPTTSTDLGVPQDETVPVPTSIATPRRTDPAPAGAHRLVWVEGTRIPAREVLTVTVTDTGYRLFARPLDGTGLDVYDSRAGEQWESTWSAFDDATAVSALAVGGDGRIYATVHTSVLDDGLYGDLAVASSVGGVTWSRPIPLITGVPLTEVAVVAGPETVVVTAEPGRVGVMSDEGARAALPVAWQELIASSSHVGAVDLFDRVGLVGPAGVILDTVPYRELGLEHPAPDRPSSATIWAARPGSDDWAEVASASGAPLLGSPFLYRGEVLALSASRRIPAIVRIDDQGVGPTGMLSGSLSGSVASWGDRLVSIDASYPTVRELTAEGRWVPMTVERLLPLRSDYRTTGTVGGPAGLVSMAAVLPQLATPVAVANDAGYTLVLTLDETLVIGPGGVPVVLEPAAPISASTRLRFDAARLDLVVAAEDGGPEVTRFGLARIAAAAEATRAHAPRYSLFTSNGRDWAEAELGTGAPIVPLFVGDDRVLAAEVRPAAAFGEDRAAAFEGVAVWVGRSVPLAEP